MPRRKAVNSAATSSSPRTVQQATQVPEPAQEEPLSGLYLFGQVIDRTRRTISIRSNNGTAEIVTYTIQDINGRRYYVDEYAPDEYYELSEYVEVPVYVKTFKRRTGDISYSFCVQQNLGLTRGEHF